ncbi:MAG: AAA family ATPase [Patescibacteria group bacterium]
MGAIIAIVNQKGGVGKTTTAVNLSSSLANLGYKVLLIDLDPQGHAGQHLGIEVNQYSTILEVLNEKKKLGEIVIPSSHNNLWVAPANLNLGQFNQQNPVGKQFVLRQAIAELKSKYDYIVYDCQPSLSLLTLNALNSCDAVILPIQAEFLALDGLSQLMLTIKEVKIKMHPKLKVLGLLVTMFDRRNNLSSEVKAELAEHFSNDLFQTVVPRNVKLAESPSFGKSIDQYDRNGIGSLAYADLAKEVVERVQSMGLK